MKPCAVDGCEASAYRTSAYCHAHEARRRRGQAMAAPVKRQRKGPVSFADLAEAAMAYADADSTDDAAWRAARQRLAKVARRYVASLR